MVYETVCGGEYEGRSARSLDRSWLWRLAQERTEGRLPQVPIGGPGPLYPALLHDNDGDAIDHGPRLVGTARIELQTGSASTWFTKGTNRSRDLLRKSALPNSTKTYSVTTIRPSSLSLHLRAVWWRASPWLSNAM